MHLYPQLRAFASHRKSTRLEVGETKCQECPVLSNKRHYTRDKHCERHEEIVSPV